MYKEATNPMRNYIFGWWGELLPYKKVMLHKMLIFHIIFLFIIIIYLALNVPC